MVEKSHQLRKVLHSLHKNMETLKKIPNKGKVQSVKRFKRNQHADEEIWQKCWHVSVLFLGYITRKLMSVEPGSERNSMTLSSPHPWWGTLHSKYISKGYHLGHSGFEKLSDFSGISGPTPLTLFGLGFWQPKKTGGRGRGGQNAPTPNLAISS